MALRRRVNVNSTMKWLWRAAEFLAWSAFFLFATAMLVTRFWLLPDVERYREDLVAKVSRSIGLPVKIGAIDAAWHGLRPQINLTDVRIFDREGREALVLPVVQNVVGYRSLVFGDLRLHSLVIEGPRLAVRRDAAGNLFVAGIPVSGAPGDRRLTDWVLGQSEIVVRNAEIEWVDEKRAAPPLTLAALNMTLRNSGERHALGLQARPPASLGSTVDLRAEVSGESFANLSDWNGKLFIEVGYTDLAAWRPWIDYPWNVTRGEGALRFWADLERGEPRQATADVALANVGARLGKDLAPLELAAVNGRLNGKVLAGGFEFGARGLSATVQRGPGISPTDLQISWEKSKQGSARASVLDLEALAHLAASIPLPADVRRKLAELAPRGTLTDARFEWSGEVAAPARYAARARFADLGMRPLEQIPGFAGLAGSFEASEARGKVTLQSRKSVLAIPRVVPDPIALDTLSADVSWERQGAAGEKGQGFTVRVASASFANAHLAGTANASYTYPGSGRGIVDLSAHVTRADGRFIPQYLPTGAIMGERTRAWVGSSVTAGQTNDARFRLKGDLAEFPWDKDPSRGLFEITVRAEKVTLEYANGWPSITDVAGDLRFHGNSMEIHGRTGSILGAQLSNVKVQIPALKAPVSHLVIEGQAEGPTASFLKYIAASPVREMTHGLTEPMSATGRGKLRVKMDMPIEAEHRDKTRISGEYEFANNAVVLHPQLPPVERAGGKIAFTQSSVALADVRGRLFGGPIAFSGGTRPGAGVEVAGKGEAVVAAMKPVFDHPWREQLTGGAPYTATVNIHEGRTRIGFESSLVGVASALPPPLAKSAAEAVPLRIEVLPADSGARDRISISLGKLAAAEFLRRRQGEAMSVQRASVWLSPAAGEAIRLPERPGTLIYGSLPALDLDRWMPLFSGGEGAADATAFDLRFGTLDLHGRRLNQVALRAGADAAGWSATIAAQEMGGDISYRKDGGKDDAGKVLARLTHFRMPDPYPGAKPADPLDPKNMPAVDAVAERFAFRGKQLGRVEIVAQRAGPDWRMERVVMTNSDAALTGKGLWRSSGQSGAPARTSVDFDLQSGDAGKFLERIGYPELVRGGKAKMQASLAWNGDPVSPDYASLAGNVQMQAEDGQFLEIEPGLGKLVSLMSLQALPRRITLDFRDVFSKGFQFDRIASEGSIERGVMHLKEFRMRGSAADVNMTGDVDLAKETQALKVRVVPSLGDTASTLIGVVNPLLAIPAALAQRVLKDPLGHIFAFDYAISGSWSDPKVAKVGVEVEEKKDPK
jgi:uncharacterized protein (TIGR02099 family)